MPSLPEDVLIEILLRLPAGDLVRFKLVCRSWYKVITSPLFAESHLQHRNGHGGIVFVLCHSDNVMQPFYLSVEDSSAGLYVDKLCYDFGHCRRLLSCDPRKFWVHYDVLDSCDGLLLTRITSDRQLFKTRLGSDLGSKSMRLKEALLVCNPITRLSRLLPVPDGIWTYEKGHIIYDVSLQRYKIVVTASSHRFVRECYLTELDSSKHRLTSWRKLKVTPEELQGTVTATVSCEGKLHWLMTMSGEPREVRLLTLDLTTEKFGAVYCSLLPFAPSNGWPVRFSGSNGKFYHMKVTSQNRFELWGLRDLNNRPTWFRRQFTVSAPPHPSWDDSYELIGECEDDKKFVFMSKTTVTSIVYEMTSRRCTSIPLIDMEGRTPDSDHQMEISWFSYRVHVNSLISWTRGS